MHLLLLSMLFATVGCSSHPAPRLIEAEQVRLPPPPAEVMVVREADFLTRLQAFFSAKPPEPTPSQTNSLPVSK